MNFRAILSSTKFYGILLVTYVIAQLGYWYFDTSVPIVVLRELAVQIAAPGEIIKVAIPIKASKHTGCSILVSRYVLDSEGQTVDVMATRFISERGLDRIFKKSPNAWKFPVKIPTEIEEGEALIITQHAYICNPLNYIWPIDQDIVIRVIIKKQ